MRRSHRFSVLAHGFASAEEAAALDQERVAALRTIFDAWADDPQPHWWTEAADPSPAGVASQLAGR
jgi:hypothetical protein